jgi:pantoate--beta-alanine ligase
MEVKHTISELQQAIATCRSKQKSVGFVPTMGALHQGHLALIERAGVENDVVIVSIFVNPTQFNDKKDLMRYPRVLENDVELLKSTPCNFVFAPEVESIYPEPDTRIFDFGNLDKVMEGKFRPGHFNGVAQVVSRLFDIVKPDKAYFGKKDFQQLAIIQEMTRMLNYKIGIVPCQIVREADGLAMSSRNMLLTSEQRVAAVTISKTLFKAVEMVNQHNIGEVINWVTSKIDENPHLETEYFDIVDDKTLASIANWDESLNKTGCIAVKCGEIRLIDNISF